MSLRIELTDDPGRFLAEAGAHLAAAPVVTTVIATVTARMAEQGTASYGAAPYRWWAIARDDADRVVGVAMRTAPFEPYPAYVLPMPDEAAVALARAVHERGEALGGVNGALPASRLVAEEYARLAGGEVSVHEHLRLFELGELTVPAAPAGGLRLARREDADLCLAWFQDFGRAAAEQAGRTEPHGSAAESFTAEDMLARIADEIVWLWDDETGATVHLTAANVPAHGVTRIGPVYTPEEQRGRGYASRAVAEVSWQYVERGVRCCLFTDQANPVSNHVYETIGYRAVVDMVNLLITR
ncbi:GNAT family N-acetyltransferase [Nocardioides sp. YIM 152315]|uniref:GNAT family N-acetyltransferase n=1 Tax=Nocardioides sp. YIM 152315 TaxID=3031760 RepID=UPI0023DC9D0F|nr:GNAT family N-acetyltransferase [Nocardioides sp. YIM 152315]MDF1603676.1 GNAT family N-acetyltransferase [Nocardioides sp. YIM 152315]